MKWGWVKAFPKFALVFLVLVGSTLAFVAWWFVFRTHKSNGDYKPAPVEDIGPKLAQVEAKHESVILLDNDLYDLESGQLIFRNWLKGGVPTKLFWEPESKTVLGQYESAFIRYSLDGAKKASLILDHPFAISEDYKSIVFVRSKDIWQAQIDWKELKLADERKVTSIAQFTDQYFRENLIFETERTLIVRNLNQIVRVKMDTGEVHPAKIPLQEIGKRRSPDSKHLVGFLNRQFYCYDVDSDETKTIAVGGGAINDYQWLGNDRCVCIGDMKVVLLYDRLKHALTEMTALPSQCLKIGEPSPDSRYVFCVGKGNGVLVDIKNKTAVPIVGGMGISWVSNDTFAFSCEGQDSNLRGMWLQAAGGTERRISSEPFIVSKIGDSVTRIKPDGMAIFATKDGLMKMRTDGTEIQTVVKLSKPPTRLIQMSNWNR